MHDGLRDRDVGIASLGAGPETRTDPLLVSGTMALHFLRDRHFTAS